MKKATNQVLHEVVHRTGGRLTPQREEIYALLNELHEPVTIQALAKHSHANEVSVYRAIKFFKENRLVEEIAYPDGTKRYALGQHHHHIICSSCGYTEHIPCTTTSSVPTEQHPKFASIDHHEVTYHGTCTTCA